jgi:hypothetical protein
MLDLLIVAYIQFVIVLIELQKVLKCLYSKTTTVLLEWTVLKAMDVILLYIYCIRNNKYLVWNVFILYIQ